MGIHILEISEEVRELILATIELLESDSSLKSSLIKTRASLSWPWEWNWFGLNKQRHKHTHEKDPVCLNQINLPKIENELPANIYAGGVELFAGALLCILTPVFPPAGYIGSTMILDGTRRVYDGVVQLGEERRADPNCIPPHSSNGYNF